MRPATWLSPVEVYRFLLIPEVSRTIVLEIRFPV